MKMNYCPNCGINISDHPGAKHCFQCGKKLDTDSYDESKSVFSKVGGEAGPFDQKYDSYGIIYTDLNALSDTYKTNKALVKNLVNKYIERLKKISHHYILVDISSEHHFSDQTSLSATDPWQLHVDLIRDTVNRLNTPIEYLFIIGGHNIIPMPVISNEPRVYPYDSDIDTDMPYAYLVGDGFEELLWDGSPFNQEVKLHVGRIPLAPDGGIQDLSSFLNRSSTARTTGFEINSLFGMSAYSWKRASEEIIRNTQFKKVLHTSPEINLYSIGNIFNHTANLFFFNLHGSDTPDNPYYFGDPHREGEGGMEPVEEPRVVTPQLMTRSIMPNIIVSEACYGAKFIDYDQKSSMLLSALAGQTAAFVGSSRVAFGSASEIIGCADVIAQSFITSVEKGINCGMALSKARVDVVSDSPDAHFNYKVTTAVEFNLFGDPVFSSNSFWNKHAQKSSSGLKRSTLKAKDFSKTRPLMTKVFMPDTDAGILEEVRESVNQEIRLIRNTLNAYLYKHFQIEEKDLNSVYSLKSGSGGESYNFVYIKDQPLTKQLLSVFTDKRGNIISVLTSK